MTGSASNPYVGPRPIGPGEKIYGREREIEELYFLWKAERIVLLHSPSGAGKSSMLQAGLLPRIRTSFDVWGPSRVNTEPAVSGVNRYVLSAMQGFEEGVPEAVRRTPDQLAGMTLAEYVETRPRRRSKASKSVALLFDQFEEILTIDPLAEEAKQAFFDQLGELLRNPRVWALFVLREDYLAPLDPFLHRVPTHLKNRFRIDLLSLEGAREAIVQPALEGGREFRAADRLLQDLATMKVQQPDGSFQEQTGRHVEPVQLQVVCFRLWNALPPEHRTIDEEDMRQFGDVSEALSGYYAESVARIAAGDPSKERAIRDWFGERLITAGGIRGQVLRGADSSEGLDNDLVAEIVDTHLVRAEERAGATWYELAHDRLIEPVQNDNAAWRAENLSEVQQRASIWEGQGRPPGLLLRDEELARAEVWARDAAVTPVEAKFLEESRKAQNIADRERRQAARIRRLGIAAMVIGALAFLAMLVAVQQMVEARVQRAEAERQKQVAVEQRAEAERQKQEAETQRAEAERQKQEAVEQRAEAERQRQTAVEEKRAADEARRESERQEQIAREQRRLAVENERKAQEQRAAAEAAQRQEAQARIAAEKAQEQERVAKEKADRLRRAAEAETLAVKTASMDEEHQRELAALLALQAYRIHQETSGGQDSPQIYNALRLALQNLDPSGMRSVAGHGGAVRSLAISVDGATLATGDEDGGVRTIALDDPQAELREVMTLPAEGVRALTWGEEGALAVGTFAGKIALRDGSGTVGVLRERGASVGALRFLDGRELVSGDCSGEVVLWRGEGRVLQAGSGESDCEESGASAVRALAVHGQAVAAASEGQGVLLWNDAGADSEPLVFSHDAAVRSVAFNRDGSRLAAGTIGGPILIWHRKDGRFDPQAEPLLLIGHNARVESLHFHPEREGVLASGSLDGTLRLWDAARPGDLPLILEGHAGWVWSTLFTPDGELLVSGSGDRTIRLWMTDPAALVEDLCDLVQRDLSAEERQEYLPDETPQTTCPEEKTP